MVTHSSDSVAVPVAGHVLRMAGKFRIGLQVVQYLFKTNDADNGDAELFLDFLDGGQFTVALFLSVQGNQHAGRFGSGGPDDVD